MLNAYGGGIDLGVDLLSGLGGVRENNDAKMTKGSFENRADYIGELVSGIKDPLVKGLAPGGFLRETIASDKMERAALNAADALSRGRASSSLTSGGARATLAGAGVGEILGREEGRMEADMKSDAMLTSGALSTLGGFVSSVRANPFYDYANGVRVLGRDLAFLAGE